MKFPIDKCIDCGLDLTTAAPAKVTYLSDKVATGTCPNCLRTYFMAEVTPVEAEPEPKARAGRRRVTEPVVEPEPELEP